MFRYSKVFIGFFVLLLVLNCKQKNDDSVKKETILIGSATVLVDETFTPIIEGQVQAFENYYDAKIKIVSNSEAEIINKLFKDKSGIAILSRDLTLEEKKIYEQYKINPKITKFATDAIAFVSNKRNTDTLVALNDVVKFLQGKSNTSIKGLVFDNPNSSTVRYMKTLAGLKIIPEKGVFSFKTNEDVIKYVAENDGMIGVVGVNWLNEPSASMKEYVDKLNILSVKGVNGNEYYYPSQNNIGEMNYPLARDLYIINCQGFSGLGMGFASFVAGDIGQRIILKSGLLPVRVPGRKINIRKEINNDKK